MDVLNRLREAINAAHVDLDGERFALRFESVMPPGPGASATEVTAQTSRGGVVHRATVGVGAETLEDHEYVVALLVQAMRKVLTGELPPGCRELL